MADYFTLLSLFTIFIFTFFSDFFWYNCWNVFRHLYNKIITIALSSTSHAEAATDSNGMVADVDAFINLYQGDPTIFEKYWKEQGDKCSVVISGEDLMSYRSDPDGECWFMEPQLHDAIKDLHRVVGNAVTDGRFIVVGTGATQIYMAALYASSSGALEPTSVVCAAPYYNCYEDTAEFIATKLFKWEGDATKFSKEGSYIELVTSPNNPDGTVRGPAVNNRSKGKLIHDLAYYWPQYTPILHKADHDFMLFTLSKATGHAGSRIGWAIVKDLEVAKKMIKFIEISSLGVARESQIRAARILQVVCKSCRNFGGDSENFFAFSEKLMARRWEKLREVVKSCQAFSLPEYPKEYCNFIKKYRQPCPAFAWLKYYKEEVDASTLFGSQNIGARDGSRFGVGQNYVRLSMLCRDEEFDKFMERFSELLVSIEIDVCPT